MIKSIIFDLGGVYFTDGTKIAIQKISRMYNLKPSAVKIVFTAGSKYGNAYRKGKISGKEFWKRFKENFQIKTKEDLGRLWIGSYKPNSGVIKIIHKLRKKEFKIYFLSDNVKERADYLQKKYDFLENFIDGVFSHKAHKTKLDKGMYMIAIRKTRKNPEEIVFIDDKKEYVETAKKLGINGIVFKNSKQLKVELDKILK